MVNDFTAYGDVYYYEVVFEGTDKSLDKSKVSSDEFIVFAINVVLAVIDFFISDVFVVVVDIVFFYNFTIFFNLFDYGGDVSNSVNYKMSLELALFGDVLSDNAIAYYSKHSFNGQVFRPNVTPHDFYLQIVFLIYCYHSEIQSYSYSL